MLEIINLSIIPAFLLVFARVLAFFIALPMFSYRTIPMTYRLGLSFFFSLIIVTSFGDINLDTETHFVFLLLKEVTVGFMISLIAYVIMAIVQIAGGFIDFQMGFAMANVVDPQTGAQSPIIGQYFYMFAILFLLAVNGHHLFIDGIYNSYTIIPLDRFLTIDGNFAEFILVTFNKSFILAFQMAIPLVGSLFLVDVALGIIARTVPQLNVFVVGLPLKITVSFAALLFFLAIYIMLIRMLFNTMFYTMRDLMIIIGGG